MSKAFEQALQTTDTGPGVADYRIDIFAEANDPSHLDPDELIDYVDSACSRDARTRIESHLARCGFCLSIMSSISNVAQAPSLARGSQTVPNPKERENAAVPPTGSLGAAKRGDNPLLRGGFIAAIAAGLGGIADTLMPSKTAPALGAVHVPVHHDNTTTSSQHPEHDGHEPPHTPDNVHDGTPGHDSGSPDAHPLHNDHASDHYDHLHSNDEHEDGHSSDYEANHEDGHDYLHEDDHGDGHGDDHSSDHHSHDWHGGT